jgi:nucleoside phosphorylase
MRHQHRDRRGLHAGQRILDLLVPEEIAYTDVDVTPLGLAFGQMLGSEPRFRASAGLLACFRGVLVNSPRRQPAITVFSIR